MSEQEKIKKLYEHGQHIGALFTSNIDRLIEENKELFKDDEALEVVTNIQLKHFGSSILGELYSSNIHPELWGKFLSLLSNHIELVKSEAERIRREHNG